MIEQRIARELSRLTRPHQLANDYILRMAERNDQEKALDFGCRDSILPSLLAAQLKCEVWAVDRDSCVKHSQPRLGFLGPDDGEVQPVHVPGLGELENFAGTLGPSFDLVTACWAIQHNEPADQTRIVKALAHLLRSSFEGSRLVVVSSISRRGATWHDVNRADPQFVLSVEDWLNRIVIPSGLLLANVEFFWYEHGTPNGDRCSLGLDPEPNAICYTLTKP